jgi:hypothetical protein
LIKDNKQVIAFNGETLPGPRGAREQCTKQSGKAAMSCQKRLLVLHPGNLAGILFLSEGAARSHWSFVLSRCVIPALVTQVGDV